METGKSPQIITLGNLNFIVRANGSNNDDGNGWTRQVDDDHHPPTPIGKGPLALLLGRFLQR